MGKNKNNDNLEDLNDIDSILNSLDGDDDFGLEEQPKDTREAVYKSVKDIGTGALENFTSEPTEKIKKFVSEAVPRGIRPEVDFLKESVNSVKKVYLENAKDLKSNTKKTIDIINSKLPDNSAIKTTLEKISKKLGVDEEINTYRQPTEEDTIATTLDELFKKKEANETARSVVDNIKEENRFVKETELSTRIIANLEAKNEFDNTYTLNYYKKSIELKIKTMVLTKEILETNKNSQVIFKSQLEAIVKNTSLPDLIKLRNSEQMKETFKQRVRDNMADMFFKTMKPLEIMQKNLQEKISNTVENIASQFNAGMMGYEMSAGMMGGDMAKYGPSKSYMLGSMLGNYGSEILSEYTSRKLEDNDTIRSKMRKFKLLMSDPKNTFWDLADSELEKNTLMSRAKSRIFRSIGNLAQSQGNNQVRMREDDPNDITTFDYRTKNSIVKIIPSLLSKIYGEVRSIRTKEEPTGLYYDYTSGQLEEKSDVKTRITKNINAAMNGVAGSNVNSILDLLDRNNEDDQMTDQNKSDLSAAILSYLVDDGSISPEGLLSNNFLKRLSKEDQELFKKRFGKVIDKSHDDIRLIDDIKDHLFNIKTNTPYIDNLVNDMYKNGNIDEVMKMGILNYDDTEGIYTVNKKKYNELLKETVRNYKPVENPNVTTSEPHDETDRSYHNDETFYTDLGNKLYKDLNDKYDIDSKRTTVSKKYEDTKTFLDDNFGTKRKALKSMAKSKKFGKKFYKDLKADIEKKRLSIENNIEVIGEMTPEEVAEFLESKTTDVLEFLKDKEKVKESIRNIGIVKTAEDRINKIIADHNIDKKAKKQKDRIMSNLEALNKKYKIDKKKNTIIDFYNSNKDPVLNYVMDNYKDGKELLGKKYEELPEEDRKKLERYIKKATVKTLKVKRDALKEIDSMKDTTQTFVTNKVEEVRTNEEFIRVKKTKFKDLFSRKTVDPEELLDLYNESGGQAKGIDFISWAKSFNFKFKDGAFVKDTDQNDRLDQVKETLIENLEEQAQGVTADSKKNKFNFVKNIFGFQKGMTPLQILHKVLTKTREWDRHIMFKVVPGAIKKVLTFPFKALGFMGKKLKGSGRNIMNFARVLSGFAPVYPEGETGKMDKLKDGLDFTRNVDKKVMKGIPGFLKNRFKNVGQAYNFVRSGGKNSYDLFTGKKSFMDIFKTTKEKAWNDSDGDGSRDGSWKDRVNNRARLRNALTPNAFKKEDGNKSGLWGMLTGAIGLVLPVLKKIFGAIGITGKTLKWIWKGIKGVKGILGTGFTKLAGLFGPLLSKLGLGALGGSVAGKVAEELLDIDGKPIDPNKPKGQVEKDIKKAELEKTKIDADKNVKTSKHGKGIDKNKVLETLRSFKDKILKRLGPKAAVKVLAGLSAKIASRLVPFAGLALLAYDATMIAKDMISNGTSFGSAVSRQILGFDIYNDDEPILDEDGNPVKPDEMSSEEFAKGEVVDEYIRKTKENPEDAEKYRQEYGISMEDVQKRIQYNRQQQSYQSSAEYGQQFNQALGGRNYLDKSGKTLAETYGKGLDLTNGTFNIGKGKEAIGKLLDDVASKTGMNANILKTFAAIESGLNPMAKAGTSSASGLFQFINSTWNDMLRKYGSKYGIAPGTSPFDPMANALMGAEFLKENQEVLKGVKKDINVADLYLAHFLGAGGAKKLLAADTNARADMLLPDAARANNTIFYKNGTPRTVGELYSFMQNLVAKKAKDFGFQAGPETDLAANTTNKNNPEVVTTKTTEYSIADGKGGQVAINKEQYDKLSEYDNQVKAIFDGKTPDPDDSKFQELDAKRKAYRQELIDNANKPKVETSAVNNTPSTNNTTNTASTVQASYDTDAITGGFIPTNTNNTSVSSPTVSVGGKDTMLEVLSLSYNAQMSIDGTLKAILSKMESLSGSTPNTQTTSPSTTELTTSGKSIVEIPSNPIDLGKKRYF